MPFCYFKSNKIVYHFFTLDIFDISYEIYHEISMAQWQNISFAFQRPLVWSSSRPKIFFLFFVSIYLLNYFKKKVFIWEKKSEKNTVTQKKKVLCRKKVFLLHKKRNSTCRKKGFIFLKKWRKKRKKNYFYPPFLDNLKVLKV